MRGLKRSPHEGPMPAGLTIDQATERFISAYNRGVRAIWESGLVLVEVRRTLDHGAFQRWIRDFLPVSVRTAQILMKIAQDQNISRLMRSSDGDRALPLPSDRQALSDLCGLDADRFDGLVENGVIHPGMQRGAVRALEVRDSHASAPGMPLPNQDCRYGAILADPAWQFSSQGGTRSPLQHYPTMSLEDIEMLPVMGLAADDCCLFLWVTSEMLHHAPRIMIQWGFEYRTTAFVWRKIGKPGLGFWTRKQTELCLLGVRGSPTRLSAGVSDLIEAPRGRHSEKPAEVYRKIEQLVPGPYLEMFARRRRDGWDAWGNDPEVQDG